MSDEMPAVQTGKKPESSSPPSPIPILNVEGQQHDANVLNQQQKNPSRIRKKRFEYVFKFFELATFVSIIITTWLLYRQVKDAQDTRMTDQRAWVMVSDWETISINGKTAFKIIFKNTGKTPAINVNHYIGWTGQRDKIPRSDEVLFEQLKDKDFYSGLYAPDATGFTETAPFDDGILAKASTGSTLYIFGTVWYDDIFGRHHWSQFGYQYDGIGCSPIGFHNTCDDANQN